jgi:hypothetical protein
MNKAQVPEVESAVSRPARWLDGNGEIQYAKADSSQEFNRFLSVES